MSLQNFFEILLLLAVLTIAGSLIIGALDWLARINIKRAQASRVVEVHRGGVKVLIIPGALKTHVIEYEPPENPPPEPDPGALDRAVRSIPVYHHGEKVTDLIPDDPRKAHAITILLESRKALGDSGAQLIAARDCTLSAETWQKGIDFLREHYGVVGIPGRGVYCGDELNTLGGLWNAVIRHTPLPRKNGTPPVLSERNETKQD